MLIGSLDRVRLWVMRRLGRGEAKAAPRAVP
jgi:hypothetical protein